MLRVDGPCLQRWLLRACVAVPLLMLAANVLAWLRWGTDLPFLDDWRAYNERAALSLSPRHLFQAVNNTSSPLGLALDALAQRWLGGNPLPYQTLSMLCVLGGLLWLQWRLIGWVVPDAPVRKLLFLLTIFMLQSGSYWGEQNLAYHQGLPVLALLGATWVNFVAPLSERWRLACVFTLGVAGGLAYVSGAVGALAMGASWLLGSLLLRGPGLDALAGQGRSGGVALSFAGILTLALQLFLTRRPGADGRGQGMLLTWPNDADFWLYAAGKLGRATGPGFHGLALEAAWVAAWVVAVLASVVFLVRRLVTYRGCFEVHMGRLTMVFLPLLAVVLAYLALVSLGRAALRPPSVQDAGEVFRFAYGRFHFFWVTLLFPWLAAVLIVAFAEGMQRRTGGSRAHAGVMLAVATAVLGLAWARGVFDIAANYRSASEFRAGEIRCLSRQLGSGQPIVCPGFDAVEMPDWTRAYVYAREIRASFVRYLPIVQREGFGLDLLRSDQLEGSSGVRWLHATPLPDGWMQGTGDPQMMLSLDDAAFSPGHCQALGLQMTLEVEAADTAQLFYRSLGQDRYMEERSVRRTYVPDASGQAQLEFTLDSPVGFEPELRLDPVDREGRWRVKDWRVTCRLPVRP